MKTKLHYIIITLLTVVLFTSCAKKMSLVKRKYTKGYYVSHSTRTKAAKAEEPVILVKKECNIKELELNANQPGLSGQIKTAKAPLAVLPKTSSNQGTKLVNFQNLMLDHSFKIVERVAPKKIQDQISAKKPDAGLVAATLSLFWIVLVVILIIYLLGLALDTFGIGNLFHLLALIFVILLILWLLRIV